MCRIPFLALNGSIRNKSRLEMVRTVCNSVIQFLKVVENATYIISLFLLTRGGVIRIISRIAISVKGTLNIHI